MQADHKKDDLQNLPARAAAFIRLVIRQMGYRKKIRQHVQTELAAHFEDGLKDCKTDREREQQAQQLIADFGDAKLLAVLMRRAKKRCRPLWRKAALAICKVVLIMVACLFFYIVWFLSGEPVISTNYLAQLNRVVPPAADESLNAAPLYDKAGRMVKEMPDDVWRALLEKYDEATLAERQLVEQWLNDNQQIFELIADGARKPYYWRQYKTDDGTVETMAVLVPDLSYFRRLAFALRWRIWRSVEQGRYEDAFRDVKSCYRLGRHLRGDKTLIEQLVGIALEALATGTLREILWEHKIESSKLAALQRDLERMIAHEDFTMSLKAERLFVYDEIQRAFTGGPGSDHIIPERIQQLAPEIMVISTKQEGTDTDNSLRYRNGDWLDQVFFAICYEFCEPGGAFYAARIFLNRWAYMLFLHPDKQETRKAAEQFFDYWQNVAAKTPAQLHAEQTDIKEQSMRIVRGNVLLEIGASSLERIFLQTYTLRANVEAVVTIIAILRYYQDTGDYSENLNRLITAGYLEKLPIDPYSDEQFVYKREGDSFILYGFGRNFKDDGGEVFDNVWRGTKERGDMVFWPIFESQNEASKRD
jgi:hypothetical protein